MGAFKSCTTVDLSWQEDYTLQAHRQSFYEGRVWNKRRREAAPKIFANYLFLRGVVNDTS